MKYFLVIILTFLINLPSCGMVFSGQMSTTDHHPYEEIVSMDINENYVSEPVIFHIEDSGYNCCSNASNGVLEKNSTIPFSIQYIPTVNRISLDFFQNFDGISTRKFTLGIYRPDSPPDQSEYISLIGSSVKNLN